MTCGDIYDLLLNAQDILYNNQLTVEEKFEAFKDFAKDISEMQQSLLYIVVHQPMYRMWEDLQIDVPNLIKKLQNLWLLPPNCGIYPVTNRDFVFFNPITEMVTISLSQDFKGSNLSNDLLDAIKYVKDDDLSYLQKITTLNTTTEYFMCTHEHQRELKIFVTSIQPATRPLSSSFGMNLVNLCLYYGAWNCLRFLQEQGGAFDSKSPMIAMHSCEEKQFKELRLDIALNYEFFEMAALCRRLWIFRTQEFVNWDGRRDFSFLLAQIGIFTSPELDCEFHSGYFTAFRNCDEEKYERMVQLCDVVYNESSEFEELKNECAACPCLPVLQRAAVLRPKMFDIYVRVASELIREGRMEPDCYDGDFNLPIMLVLEGIRVTIPTENGRMNADLQTLIESFQRRKKKDFLPYPIQEDIKRMRRNKRPDENITNPNTGLSVKPSIHPGYSKLFGFAIFNDEAEKYKDLVKSTLEEEYQYYELKSELWRLESIRQGSINCIKVVPENGIQMNWYYMKEAIKGGVIDVFEECYKHCTTTELLEALRVAIEYRRLEFIDLILDKDLVDKSSDIIIELESLLGYHFLPPRTIARLFFPSQKNLLAVSSFVRKEGNDIWMCGVIHALRLALEQELPDLKKYCNPNCIMQF